MVQLDLLRKRIEDGYYHFEYELEPDYYDSWDEEDLLIDCNGLGTDADDLLHKAVTCVMRGSYSIGYAVFECLFDFIISDDDVGDPITIETLFIEDWVRIDQNEVLCHYAFAAIQILEGEARIIKLHDIVHDSSYQPKTSEILKLKSGDIAGEKEFLQDWIAFLLEKYVAMDAVFEYQRKNLAEYIIDAVIEKGGLEELERFTAQYGDPCFLAYLELAKLYFRNENISKTIDTARAGIDAMPEDNTLRAELADMLADAGKIDHNINAIDAGILAAARSAKDLPHFLRLYQLSDISKADSVKEYYLQHPPENIHGYCIRILLGDFDSLWEEVLTDKAVLGWSGSKKGNSFPLFIALLTNGCRKRPYLFTLFEENLHPDKILLEELLEKIDSQAPALSLERAAALQNWCVKETVLRVDAIVGEQHRNSYYKAASLTLAMMEMIEFRSGKESGAAFIKKIRDKYPRHRAFQDCLRKQANTTR
ncbi:MAG: hypothetical protein LBO74_01425 [Candidatus Symbiothrix sp.]|nr:hypothetical protein [Candidatus Symbiothrix sp.]